jgi:hypothetical protein
LATDGVFNPGFYIEGSDYNGIIGCVSWTDSTGNYWALQTTTDAGSTWTTLWQAGPGNLPNTEDCTVVTNRSNDLAVYVDNVLVYSSTSLNLQFARPFQTYLEVESSYAGAELSGTFTDFYATTGTTITLTGIRAEQQV